MQPTEFRRGNIISHKALGPILFWSNTIGFGGDWIISRDKQGTSGIDAPIGDFEPIKLESSELLKLGFEKLSERHFRINQYPERKHMPEYWDVFAFTWNATGDESCDYWQVKQGENFIANNAEVMYIHQLQNLYFALTGKELEFDSK